MEVLEVVGGTAEVGKDTVSVSFLRRVLATVSSAKVMLNDLSLCFVKKS